MRTAVLAGSPSPVLPIFYAPRGVSDSLARRAEILHVYPFSQGELTGRNDPEDWVAWILAGAQSNNDAYAHGDEVRRAVINGGYPVPSRRKRAASKARWYESYTYSLATHDASELSGSGTFAQYLLPLLRTLSQQGHAELNKAKTARTLGISETALTDYLALAGRMYLTESTPGWGVGLTNRAVKRPKISVADTGLASFFSGLTLEKSRLLGGRELFGALLDAFVVSELHKQRAWARERYTIHHFRERDTEVDVVLELADGRVILVEVKAAHGVDARSWKHLLDVSQKVGERVVARVVLHTGTQNVTVKDRGMAVHLLPVGSLWQHPTL